jgi:branched-chain amino acid transport system substrate-binding protein
LRQLAREHRVTLAVGGVTSDEARALVEVADQERVVCLSPSAPATDQARRSRYFFRLYVTDEAEGQAAARHLGETLGIRRLLVYTDDSPLTRGVESEFRQHFEFALGGRIVDTVHLGEDRWPEHSTDALHIHDPEAVYIVGHAASILHVLGHLAATGFRPIRCTTSAFYVSDVLSECGELADGVLFPLPASVIASDREPADAFVAAFSARFGNRPDIYAAHGYDAMRLAIESLLDRRSVNAAELRRYFDVELQEFRGVTGPIAFNDHQQATRYPTMHCVWKGQVISCERLKDMKLRQIRELLQRLDSGTAPAGGETRPTEEPTSGGPGGEVDQPTAGSVFDRV